MSAHVLSNLLNQLQEKIRCEFNKSNNTGTRMQDSICHMTLKSHLIRRCCTKKSRFRHKKTQRFNGRQHITLPGNLPI